MRFELAFVLLFAIATAVALVVRRLKVPYTVALVGTGLVLGTAKAFEPPHLTKDLLYAVFLPGLVFEAAYHLELGKFWQSKLAIHALAIPGVLASMVLTAGILVPTANALHFVDGFTLDHGLVFGALIAATDPIAVVALFKTLGVPKRLSVLVEGESLLNDGTAAVFFTLAVGVVLGRPFSASVAAIEFLKIAGLGLVIGVAIGASISKVIERVDDPMIEITLTTIAAWGSFVVAEQLHLSGVISTVGAGLMCGNYAARTGMSPTTRVAAETFWEYVAFALNSIVFLLIGFEVHVADLAASWKPILAAYVAGTIARAAMTYVVSALLWPTRERLPWSWAAILTWGGLRGGLSMVLVLGLAPGFPHRDLLVTMTFGVVVLSILVQGLTMAPLLRRLGLVGAGAAQLAYEVQRAAARAAKAALQALERMVAEGALHADVAAELRREGAARLEAAEAKVRELHLAASELEEEERRAARHQLLVVEKDVVLDQVRRGLLGEEGANELLSTIDARLLELEGASARRQ